MTGYDLCAKLLQLTEQFFVLTYDEDKHTRFVLNVMGEWVRLDELLELTFDCSVCSEVAHVF